MPIFAKKRIIKAMENRREDLKYMFEHLSAELLETEKKLDNISYQIDFFGSTPELKEQKMDCELILSWIQGQFDEIKKALFHVNSQALTH